MGIRKNVKFLTAAEREDFVKACVLMKADIVNPGAPAVDQYSKWDEYVAVHRMIQSGIAPGGVSVNFGHGGSGSFSFLSWHRYFLYLFEKDLQSYVPGVMLHYWDWSDPSSVMTDTFLGPNGNAANNNVIERGYFAFDRPGTGANTTPLPAWYPAGLNGWRMPAMFPSNFVGGLKRRTQNVSLLPSVNDIRTTLGRSNYSSFQNTLESGAGLASGNQMHNGMHGWIGGGTSTANQGHMSSPSVSPFDPFFYLHHCNIDRLWAMWQMDGHQNEYPTMGGDSFHHRNDLMYPWVGGAAGYSTSASIQTAIPMPNYAALGPQRNVDTLDFRAQYDYTYDTIAIIGIGLDRTGSMNGLTPDPMVSGLPDVTKWEAAKRGVSAFLQDCETVQNSGAIYVGAGVRTFRSLAANEFSSVFGAPGWGLVKGGTAFSKANFDAAITTMSPGGGTPLADALLDVKNTIADPPFSRRPADENRYIAMLTDGILTSGSPFSSIPNGSLSNTVIFAMGFGTGLEVDYGTLATMVAKGESVTTSQIFHGENAGTIDKFFTNSLASAIGFTAVFDPVLEMFEGEHTHLSFTATSADDSFLLTVQGMDYSDRNWSFILHGPNGQVLYGDQPGHAHNSHCNHCCEQPNITTSRSNGRLTMVIQRGNTGKECWVGVWTLMVAYRAKYMDKMLMPELGELLIPVSAGPVRGPKYARLLTAVQQRKATRNIFIKSQHGLDFPAVGTNSNERRACNLVMNVYAKTRLKIRPELKNAIIKIGEEMRIDVTKDVLLGNAQVQGGFARLIAPAFPLEKLISKDEVLKLILTNEKSKRYSSKLDIALQLARIEREKKELRFIEDSELKVVAHGDSPLHIHHQKTEVEGVYHIGLIVEGMYYPEAEGAEATGHHHGGGADEKPKGEGEQFSRIFNITAGVGA
ncbi:MAG: tyrosinase family protein [Saprospiraceae bacterium]|nr:tyrosinase family protein [Saprospiraceae bacterium]